jgi:hypothetical protein
MTVKAATVVGVMDASAPPASTTSHRPSATIRAPAATEWVPAAQAVVSVSEGPWKPCRSDTAAAPAFGITMGMVNGDTRPGPRSVSTPTCVSEGADAADAGAELDADPGRIELQLASVVERHLPCCDGELREAVQVAADLPGHPRGRVEVVDGALAAVGGRRAQALPERRRARCRPERRRPSR